MPARLTTCIFVAAMAAAAFVLPSAAQARHGHHHRHMAKVKPLPAHQKPGYAAEAQAALLFPVDLGMGPVFPFAGVPLK